MLPRSFLLSLPLLVIANIGLGQTAKTVPAITAHDIYERLSILASDSLEGRRSGTPGADKAANYISSEFRRLKLTSLTDKSYLQQFSFSERAIDTTRTGRTSAENVLAMIPGTDPKLKDEVIVVGAHYDHLGWGDKHFALDSVTAIHYGADDNASGSAGVLELAEALASTKLKRSVLFMSFSGEEEGLFGSDYFVEHPLVPLKNIVAMINMDMIGRLQDSTLIVQGIGTSPSWKDIVTNKPEAKPLRLKLTQTGRGPSDHSKFNSKDIPVLFFFTGFHPDYHKATDTKEKINTAGEAQVLELAKSIVLDLANRSDRPAFSRVAEDTSEKQTSFHVYVGGVPDYGYDGDGVRISEVTDHSPAQAAGLQKDDVIINFGGQVIHNIYDYTDALSKHVPGDVVITGIIRKEVKMTVNVTLGSRGANH
jgi:aminopeptidase YwaD